MGQQVGQGWPKRGAWIGWKRRKRRACTERTFRSLQTISTSDELKQGDIYRVSKLQFDLAATQYALTNVMSVPHRIVLKPNAALVRTVFRAERFATKPPKIDASSSTLSSHH